MLSTPTFDLSEAAFLVDGGKKEIGNAMTSKNVADKNKPPDTLSVPLTLYIFKYTSEKFAFEVAGEVCSYAFSFTLFPGI